ncbi:Nudix family hydrolase [Candidatus Methylocalor cossyra]|uniref:8-oxo-dGTP diphosphatase n=1 Tax=Candidatus Methylocalor cossyra TaxID=3108543 RepID=A0ABP1CA76_9GAMM
MQSPPTESAEPPWIEVAAGVIRDAAGRILIAQRAAHQHQGNCWEFPGGKREPGEGEAQTLERELKEELDIEVLEASPLIALRHRYPDRAVRLSVWRVERFRGVPRGRLGQTLRWVRPEDLDRYPFPPANRSVLAAVRLPDHYAILDLATDGPARLMARLHHYAALGITLVRLRAPRPIPPEYGPLAAQAVATGRSLGLTVLVDGSPELAQRVGAAGLHLNSAELWVVQERPLAPDRWLAASCHDGEQLRRAARIGADFAVLSPVGATATHPGAAPLGWDGFAALAELATIPVFALGGLGLADTVMAKRHGGQGVAAIRGFIGPECTIVGRS